MKSIFLSEMGFTGKVPRNHDNMRTEFAWMVGLGAEHDNIGNYKQAEGYDSVFLILPKLRTSLSADATSLGKVENPSAGLYDPKFIDTLKEKNKKVYIIQEGPSWLFNDYEVSQQFGYINSLLACDGIFVHNEIDKKFYVGITYNQVSVHVIPTLMIEDILPILPKNGRAIENKTIIGGNFSRWYGGTQSYLVARLFGNPIWAQTSHSKRDNEESVPDLQHLPRLSWIDWMKNISTYKYAVHLMPTIAAGTFSLNCAYYGIPCIGNKDVDTQNICHPELSVDVNDVEGALKLAAKLRDDADFYKKCAIGSHFLYNKHYTEEVWKIKMEKML
tara:strand:- start:985 stop:1977 length:993 start_codon:yes stop_codon:yes gene_type:complete